MDFCAIKANLISAWTQSEVEAETDQQRTKRRAFSMGAELVGPGFGGTEAGGIEEDFEAERVAGCLSWVPWRGLYASN